MKEIQLTQGYIALIDNEDFERVSKHSWWIQKNGRTFYARSKIKQRKILLHRFIMNCTPEIRFDHKNRNGLDCRKENLRKASRSQNRGNSIKQISIISSKYKGVLWDKIRNKWCVRVANKHINYFDSEIEAAITYDQVAMLYFQEFALTNFEWI